MKKLLLLLVFSASLFASAQTVNVVELTLGNDIFKHVYPATTVSSTFDYNLGEFTVSNTMHITFSESAVQIGDVSYNKARPEDYSGTDVESLINDLGFNGKWFDSSNDERLVSPNFFVVSPSSPLVMDGWTAAASSTTSFSKTICDYNFIANYTAGIYIVLQLDGTSRVGSFYRANDAADVIAYANTSFIICELEDDHGWTIQRPQGTATLEVGSYIFTASVSSSGEITVTYTSIVLGDESGTLIDVGNGNRNFFEEPLPVDDAARAYANRVPSSS